MKNIKNIDQFAKDIEIISENKSTVKGFKNFDTVNELNAEIDLSKEEILSKRAEISNKITEIETELDTNDNDTEVENIDELELELESLKKEFTDIQLLAEKKVFNHKSIVIKK